MFKEIFTESRGDDVVGDAIKELSKKYPKKKFNRKYKFGDTYIQVDGNNALNVSNMAGSTVDFLVSKVEEKIK